MGFPEIRRDPIENWGSRYQDGKSDNITSGAIAASATTVLWTPTTGYQIRIQKIIVNSKGSAGTVVSFWLNSSATSTDLSSVEPDFVVDTNSPTNAPFDVDILGSNNESLHFSCPDKTFILVHGREEI